MLYDRNNNYFLKACTKFDLMAACVRPTASLRTVKLFEEPGWFVKLHYNGLIGRVDRSIGVNQALSAIEVSKAICDAIDRNILPEFFYFMPETFARVAEVKGLDGTANQWGMVLRAPNPYPLRPAARYCIPAFSLFAVDMHKPDDPSLLSQLIKRQNKKAEDYLFEDIIAPLYKSYFELLINCGLGLECHAQNTLFVINDQYEIVGMVAKDAESIDKDISLMDDLGIPYDYKSTEYKWRVRSSYKYHIMHSFFFDNKMGEYLIFPMIEHASKFFPFDIDALINRIKESNQQFVIRLPADFFPKDIWYTNAPVVHDRSGSQQQEYIINEKPKFR
jgi:siderophore synthetase component